LIPIQFVLISGLLLLGFEYFTRLRSRLWDRILVIAFSLAGIGFVAYPDYATKLANRVGVGRGTDLLLYISLLGVGFILMLLFSAIRELQEKMTGIAREIALLGAEQTPPPDQVKTLHRDAAAGSQGGGGAGAA
jgi:hypothetical protein